MTARREIVYISEGIKAVSQTGDRGALAILKTAGDDLSAERIYAEYLIAEAMDDIEPWHIAEGTCYYDVALVDDCDVDKAHPEYHKDWLLEGKPAGTVVPPPTGRESVRTPNLNSANPSFAALLIMHVRDRFEGDAPRVYRAAHISRKTYSSIISNELRPVAKQTAMAFALALNLQEIEADELLQAAGHAFSRFILEDMVVLACIKSGIYNIERVNSILLAHNARRLSCQEPCGESLPCGDNLGFTPEAAL